MGRLFGTDGIRGAANEYPLTAEAVFEIGRAIASFFGGGATPTKIIIAKDTRESGGMIEDALASGICSTGADACLAGILPTPAVAYLVSSNDAAAGIVISASHNPIEDNGIKFFARKGQKLSDEQEKKIEDYITGSQEYGRLPTGNGVGRIKILEDAGEIYLEYICKSFEINLKGYNIVLDCANGAASFLAEAALSRMGRPR